MQSDQELIERYRSGDSSAFGELFQRHGRKIYALAYRMTGTHQEAEDTMQDTFLRAHRYITASDRDISNVHAWLRRVAINRMVDQRRSERAQESMDAMSESEIPNNPAQSNPGSDLENKELGEYIDAAIEELPIKQRWAFVLKNLEGLSHRDIAIRLGCSQDAVRANLYQAVKKLRGRLKKYVTPGSEAKDAV